MKDEYVYCGDCPNYIRAEVAYSDGAGGHLCIRCRRARDDEDEMQTAFNFDGPSVNGKDSR